MIMDQFSGGDWRHYQSMTASFEKTLLWLYGFLTAAVSEYQSIFVESEENERIDREIRRARYAVRKGIPLEEVQMGKGPMVE